MRAGRWKRRVAIGLVALYAVIALPGAMMRSARALRDAVARRGEDLDAARRRTFGADYVAGIERARAAIPHRGEYLLFDAGGIEEGAANWTRYDLAPRRAVLGGRVERLGRPERVRLKLRGAPATCVVARPGAAALVMTQEEFVAWLAEGTGGE